MADKRSGFESAAGFVLTLVLFTMLLLMGLAILSLRLTLSELRTSALLYNKAKTLYQAETGLNRSLGYISRGFRDSEHENFVPFDPLEPQAVFQKYVDDATAGLGRYSESGRRDIPTTYLISEQGVGTVDYKVLVEDLRDIRPRLKGDKRAQADQAIGDLSLPEGLGEERRPLGRSVGVLSRARHIRGAGTNLRQRIILSYLPNVIFRYGMLTNRLKECQFCHMRIRGDLGQVGDHPFEPISPHVTIGRIDGNFYLSGSYALDQHPSHKQLVEVRGKIIEHAIDSDVMPKQWPAILDREDPKQPKIAGFYINLAERAYLQGSAYVRGGEIMVQKERADRFERQKELRAVTNRHTILQGTRDKPIELSGPSVIRGDLIISGYVKGQGSIYVERNIYVVGDIVYSSRPNDAEWNNVFRSERRRQQREGIDFRFDKLGLFAGGNVIIGDLSHSEVFRYAHYFLNYESSGMLPSAERGKSAAKGFAQGGPFDGLGIYAMDGGSGRRITTIRAFYYNDRYEDGSDYNKNGKKSWGEGMRWVVRENIEVDSIGLLPAGSGLAEFKGGWISKKRFRQLAKRATRLPASGPWVSTIDATIYTDGAFTGYKPSNDRGKSEKDEYTLMGDIDSDGITFHGAVIARDVDVLAPGGWYVHYDNRNYVGEGASINFEPSRVVEITGWREE